MLYLVDGYNVTRSDPATRGLSLEEQRVALSRRLAARGPTLLGRGRIVIVFDGAQGAGTGERIGEVDVRYSRSGQSADDAIVSAASGASGDIVLVTSDNGLAARVRDHLGKSVQVLPRESCFEDARPKARKKPSGVARDEGLPKGANLITEEFKKIWLDTDADTGE
jgi:hypothetical protein